MRKSARLSADKLRPLRLGTRRREPGLTEPLAEFLYTMNGTCEQDFQKVNARVTYEIQKDNTSISPTSSSFSPATH